ncbi:hypothetical protein CC78DRAFT_611351 [Lojkania enalia]|uniref:Uncharacterized protein n=1 Tax=Lojkania enalia TaxID=147567 RepID=A0A9P4NC04_9PLEO|nr:hypothetical protein CC78DRAFT_611351 [Didymosphaeria enalia]
MPTPHYVPRLARSFNATTYKYPKIFQCPPNKPSISWLQRQCLQYLDTKTLKSFRLVSQIASVVGAEQLFETVVLRFKEESPKKLANILEHETFKPLVKKIIIDGQAGDKKNEENNEDDDGDESEDGEDGDEDESEDDEDEGESVDEDKDEREGESIDKNKGENIEDDRIKSVDKGKSENVDEDNCEDGDKNVDENVDDDDDEDEGWIDTPWSLAIPKISLFPSVREVEFWFDDECGVENEYPYDYQYRQNEEYRRRYQKLFFNLLSKMPLVNNITIKNMQDASTIYTGPEEVSDAVLHRIEKLALMIITEYISAAPEYSIDQPKLHECFNWELSSHWLMPTQPQLTSLTLYCDTYWGVWPYIDLRGVHFPKLISLALGNWTIAHNWQIEWITSHGETLRELVLDDCPIAYALRMGPKEANTNFPEMRPASGWPDDTFVIIRRVETRWNDVFPMFEKSLKKLNHLGMSHGDWHGQMFDRRYDLPARIENSRYIVYDCGTGPCPWTEEYYEREYEDGIVANINVPEEEQHSVDKEALNSFLEAIGKSKAEIERMKKR